MSVRLSVAGVPHACDKNKWNAKPSDSRSGSLGSEPSGNTRRRDSAMAASRRLRSRSYKMEEAMNVKMTKKAPMLTPMSNTSSRPSLNTPLPISVAEPSVETSTSRCDTSCRWFDRLLS